MIELKINNRQRKRTIIDSIRCQIVKEKDKFYLMRFKSLPVNKRMSRNGMRLDLPQTVKAKQNQKQRHFLQKVQFSNFDRLVTSRRGEYRQKWQQSVDHKYTLNDEESCLENADLGLKAFSSEDKQNIKRRFKTIHQQPTQKIDECSLRNYIQRHLSLKQTSLKRDAIQIAKLTIQNQQRIDFLKKSRQHKSNLSTLKSSLSKQSTVRDLFSGILSPNLCQLPNVKPTSPEKEQNTCNIFKRTRIYKNLDDDDVFQDTNQTNFIGSLKKHQLKKLKNSSSAFKNSIGPWRNNLFCGGKV